MQTFEVGKIYQSRVNEHRRILVVGRTRCYITVQFITDGNHAIDETQRLKIRPALGNSGEMIFDTTDTYYAALEVTETPVKVSMNESVKVDNQINTENQSVLPSERVRFVVGNCYVSSHDDNLKVLVLDRDSSYLAIQEKYGGPIAKRLRIYLKLNGVEYCVHGTLVFCASNPAPGWDISSVTFQQKGRPSLPELELRKKVLVDNFVKAFKDNYRNENPERLHPPKHHLTYSQVLERLWVEKKSRLLGLRTYDEVYHAIRSEGYVINQTTLTVESKRFKPCDIKVGGR